MLLFFLHSVLHHPQSTAQHDLDEDHHRFEIATPYYELLEGRCSFLFLPEDCHLDFLSTRSSILAVTEDYSITISNDEEIQSRTGKVFIHSFINLSCVFSRNLLN